MWLNLFGSVFTHVYKKLKVVKKNELIYEYVFFEDLL